MASWTEQDQAHVFELVKPVLCDGSYGTAFPIRATSNGVWYVTCDHVLGQSADHGSVTVGGRPATEVLRGGPKGLDLALVCVKAEAAPPVSGADVELALAPLIAPPHACRIPGCHRPADPESKKFPRKWVDANIGGERADVISEDGVRDMKGWSLEMRDDTLLEKGYSGAPVCTPTSGVFAVAVMRTDQGAGGIAICISSLAHLLPDELRGLLPPAERRTLAELVRLLVSAPSTGLDPAEIRAVVRRSAPATAHIEFPDVDEPAAYCDWLLDQCPWSTRRDALYDVLDRLEARAGAEQSLIDQIHRCKQLRMHEYPDLDTESLPDRPVGEAQQPVLIEVIIEPLPNASCKEYEAHSYFHPADGHDYRSGPVRDANSGGRLDLHDQRGLVQFALELTRRRMALEADAESCVFQFRVPLELMLYAFEDWPKNRLGQKLGREHAVVVGSIERDWDGCEGHWQTMQAAFGKPLRRLVQCCTVSDAGELTESQLEKLLADLRRTPCLVLDRLPGSNNPDGLTHLRVVAEIGVAGLWPRSRGQVGDFCSAIDIVLGSRPVEQLPFVVRDLRRGESGGPDISPAFRQLVLFWDDPSRSARRPGADPEAFFPGFGPAAE